MKQLAVEREAAIKAAGERRADNIALERAIENARVLAALFHSTAEAFNTSLGGPVQLFPFLGVGGDAAQTVSDLEAAGKNLLMTSAIMYDEYTDMKEASRQERSMQRATMERINEYRESVGLPPLAPVKTFTTAEVIDSMTAPPTEEEVHNRPQTPRGKSRRPRSNSSGEANALALGPVSGLGADPTALWK